MLFGLTNSPSVFQAFVNDVFLDMFNQWLIVYIDDILIYSDMLESHVQHVRTVLQHPIKHQLYAKNFSFMKPRLYFIFSAEGEVMNEKKVESVLS